MTKTYKLAGHVIQITAIHDEVHDYWAGFETDEAPELTITTTPEEIAYETQRDIETAAKEGRKPYYLPEWNLETLSVYRKICCWMPLHDTILFHGSAIAVDGQAFLFTAKSGTGKSTHTSLWRELLGDRAVMVNDDKPLLQVTDSGVIIHGTPYMGKHNLGSNIAVPLKAICILTRSEENHIERITKAAAYTMLLQQTYRPQNSEAMRKTLSLIDKLAAMTELYRLGCNMDISAAETAYNAMKG